LWLVGTQNGMVTVEDSLTVFRKTIIQLLGIHRKELKTDIHTKTCTWMFMAVLSTLVKTWKQPRCPSVGE